MISARCSAFGFALLALTIPSAWARVPRRIQHVRHAAGITARKRLHINDLITVPGTAELDWGNLYSYTSGSDSMPSSLKFTPDGNGLWIGRTEYSVAFDSIASVPAAGQRVTQFSDRFTVAATSIVLDTEKFDVALAPQATFFLRDQAGARLGGSVLARSDMGLNSFGGSVGWTGATQSSVDNPAGSWDFTGGYGRQLASSGILSRLTPHLDTVLEKSVSYDRSLALFAGMEYQVTKRLAVDVTGQRYGLAGGGPDRQVLIGMTLNFGKVN